MAPLQEYTLEEIKVHNKPDDLWVIIEGKVYDLTKFRLEHPGGEETLDEVGGRDGTEGFNDVGHSSEAKEMMKKYLIGKTNAPDPAQGKRAYSISTTEKNETKPKQCCVLN